MADSNSPILNLLLMGDDLHNNDWGDQTNTNLTKIENAIKGLVVVTVTGSQNITQAQAAYATIFFSGTPGAPATLTVPAVANQWRLINGTGQPLTITTGSGASVVLPSGANRTYLCDGTDIIDASPETEADSLVPIGAIIEYPSLTSPNANYHLADGSAISRTTYAALFAKYGTTFGSGDGSTTFNLPDRNGRCAFQADNGSGRFNGSAIGAVGGVSGGNVTLSSANMPSHTHTLTDPGHGHATTDPGHTHTVSGGTIAGSSGAGFSAGGFPSITGTGNIVIDNHTTGLTVNSATTGISVNSAGSGTPFSALPPFFTSAFHVRIQ